MFIRNYINTSKKVDGFTTKFNRLMSLKIIDNIVYTVGLPGKSAVPKSSIMKNQLNSTKKIGNNSHAQHESKSLVDISPFKLFIPQHVENNDKSLKRDLLGLNSTKMKSSLNDFKYQLTIDPSDTTLLTPDFFKIDLERPPFNLTRDEANKLNSEYQPNKIKITQKPTKTKTTQHGKRSSVKKNSKTTNTNSSSKRKNSSNQSIAKHVPQQSQMTNAQQTRNNQSSTNVNLQNLQLQSFGDPTVEIIETDTQEPLQPKQKQLLQKKAGNSIHKASTSKQQQKKLTPKPARTRLATQSVRKNILQQDQQQLQTNIIHKPSTNPSQQQQYQKIQPNRSKKKNVQTRQLQQQTNFGLSDVNAAHSDSSHSDTQPQVSSPSVSAAGVPVRVALKHKKSTSGSQSPSAEKLPPEEYERLRQAVMASLLQTNPGMFSHGQPVIGEITRSQPTNQSLEDSSPNLQTESQQNRNLKK